MRHVQARVAAIGGGAADCDRESAGGAAHRIGAEVRSGFDEAGAHFSVNDATEFQIISTSGGVVRFRARTKAEMLDWLVTVRAEVTVAVEERDDPVHIIHSLLDPLMDEARSWTMTCTLYFSSTAKTPRIKRLVAMANEMLKVTRTCRKGCLHCQRHRNQGERLTADPHSRRADGTSSPPGRHPFGAVFSNGGLGQVPTYQALATLRTAAGAQRLRYHRRAVLLGRNLA